MRFLYLTDTHCRGSSPTNRKDDFAAAMYRKLEEVAFLANELRVTALLHGGDLWDFPNPTYAEADLFLTPFKATEAPLYIIAGNHDLQGQDLNTLPYTMLGIQNAYGRLRLIGEQERIYFTDQNLRVQITGQSYHAGIDRRDPRLDYCIEKQECDFAINLVHGTLLTEERFPGSTHTHVSQIQETEADLTLVGHRHFGFPDYEYQGKRFMNIGALSRLINHPIEIKRPVQVLLVDLSGVEAKISKIPLKSAWPGYQVLDPEKAGDIAIQIERLAKNAYYAQNTEEFGACSIQDIVDIIGVQEGFSKEIRLEALRRLHIEIEYFRSKYEQ